MYHRYSRLPGIDVTSGSSSHGKLLFHVIDIYSFGIGQTAFIALVTDKQKHSIFIALSYCGQVMNGVRETRAVMLNKSRSEHRFVQMLDPKCTQGIMSIP